MYKTRFKLSRSEKMDNGDETAWEVGREFSLPLISTKIFSVRLLPSFERGRG